MSLDLSHGDQFPVRSRIEQEIRVHDLSLLRVAERRLQLAVRVREFKDLRRLIAGRKRLPASVKAQAGSRNQMWRRTGDNRQRRVSN